MSSTSTHAKNPSNSTQSNHEPAPQRFAAAFFTPGGALLFQEDGNTDGWISSDTVQEVQR